ncbi:alpha/beta fold hydrolase [Rhodothermus profundi]|uniref:Pimeloyl-ACP methyl ester carboxylesterase n=1 Tax=Rhodothermus profundi TaxID=633813 RepID=A0A1M6UP27_9BACT|nr:alpha/beta fold hydrolase [Rhodothermus profundi]AKZ20825.1 thermophilic carboxylesterase [uncultured bacterium]SHK70974.1 Pimeloyl-ACP methyl ester carboxylesterase [Rhodothermus profundi]
MPHPTIQTVDLAYRSYGTEGPPLLILHGLLGSSGNWHTLARNAFSPHFRVFALDLRGHGRSPHAHPIDYPTMAADVQAFMDRHHLESAHVLGHSMGGKVAMELALSAPERVRRLVVVDIAPRSYPARHRTILDALQAIDPARYANRQAIDQALATYVPEAPIRQFLLKNLLYNPATRRYTWQVDLDGLVRYYDRINAAITDGRQFTGPVLFVRGARSDYLTEADWPTIRQLFPDACLATIPEAGHWVHADAPEAFAHLVLAFLQEKSGCVSSSKS